MAEENTPTIEEAVNDATKSETAPAPEETKPESEVEKEPEVSEEEIKQARNIVQILRDPEQSKNFVEYLAKQSGLIVEKGEATPKEAKEATIDALEDALSEYPELRSKLVPALKKAISDQLTETKATLQEIKKEGIKRELDSAWDAVTSETEGDFTKYEKAIIDLMDELPYSGGSYKTYLKRLYAVASSDDSSASRKIKIVEKINNSLKAPKVPSGETDSEKISLGSKLPTVEEAIAFAVQGKKIG